jgi:ubiquinone/menaquinone biosynthesis C-methylase UbiE
MSFDRIAPHYRWMECALAGRCMQRSRTAFLDRVAPRRALLAGEGHGRFLKELLERHPQTHVTVVDASAAMLREASAAIVPKVGGCERIEFVHADLLEWEAPFNRFDLIGTHFFFDCFAPGQIEMVASRLSNAATARAQWLLADFSEPAKGPLRWRAKTIVWALYRFFRWSARLSAVRLTSPDHWLESHGFTLKERRYFDWGMLHSDLWSR